MRKSYRLFCVFIMLIITMLLSTGCGKEVPVNDNNDNISSSKANEEKHPNSEIWVHQYLQIHDTLKVFFLKINHFPVLIAIIFL